MKVAFCGSSSVGKTTLLDELRKDPSLKDYIFIDEITRKINSPINEEGNDDTQIMILSSHVSNLNLGENLVMDRSIIDGYLYTKYLNKHGSVSDWLVSYGKKIHDHIIGRYDIVFYIPVEIPLHNDGIRSSSESFRDGIEELFDEYIDYNDTIDRKVNIEVIKGSVQERLIKVKSAMKSYERR